MNYATNIAFVDKETNLVTNVIWGLIYQLEEFEEWGQLPVPIDDLFVQAGDIYIDGKFYHDGEEVHSTSDELASFHTVDVSTAPPPKLGYLIRMNYIGGHIVFDYVEDPNYDGKGTYINPIRFVDGMEVIKGSFYTDTEDIWEAIATGYPESFADKRFFDIIEV